ncbi:MAG TPA: TetR/AcrR family transcriptional regulator [Micromonosporaceae bacterium]|nr:TetR/AcrR family transcriptional regulator [Micromonosporaceae bacterium]
MAGRQEQLVDAAIEVLGAYGLRRLTHRAVDVHAGLPAGSTSNYFRTRHALLTAVLRRMSALDRADWRQLTETFAPRDAAELSGQLTRFVANAIGPGRHRTLARYALCVEAASRPDLQEELRSGNAEIVGWAAPWLRRIGSPEPERDCRLVLDYLDGVMFHQVAFADPTFDPEPGIRLVLGSLLR